MGDKTIDMQRCVCSPTLGFGELQIPLWNTSNFPPLQTKANERKQSIFYQYVDTIALEDERWEAAGRHMITYQRVERQLFMHVCLMLV